MTLADAFRREADECDAYLRGDVVREPWMAPGVPARIEVRRDVLRECADAIDAEGVLLWKR